jgi:hypothetical protein
VGSTLEVYTMTKEQEKTMDFIWLTLRKEFPDFHGYMQFNMNDKEINYHLHVTHRKKIGTK